MARLEGVKVFDAKEGSIEKLKYDGDIYDRTKDLPKKGDIALVNVAWGDQIEGGYYLVNNEDNDTYEIAKNLDVEKDYVFIDGETEDADTKPHRVEIFRKQEEQKDVKEGDLIEMLEDDEWGDFQKGDRFQVLDDGEPELHFKDNRGDKRLVLIDKVYDYKIIGKSEVEFGGKTYEYVDRKAKEGDVIIPLETSSIYFTNGKLYGPVNGYLMVIDDYGDSLSVYSEGDNRKVENVLVYEPVIENKTIGKRGRTTNDFKKGMRVKLDVVSRPKYDWGSVSNGDLGVVTRVHSEVIYVDFEKQSMWAALPAELIILDENTEETEYKVGDLVEITEEGSHEFEVGEVVRLNKVDAPTGQPYRAERVEGDTGNYPWLYGHEFKRFDGILGETGATLDEKPETPTYKIGDIVCVTVEWGSSNLEVGDIGIITERHGLFGMFRVVVPGKENEGKFKFPDNIRHADEAEKGLFAINLVKEGAFA